VGSEETQLLRRAEQHFEEGNYLEAGQIAERLANSSDRAVAAQAVRLQQRLSPAPLTRYLLGLTFLLLLAVTLFAYLGT
jgi:hypothetical protein